MEDSKPTQELGTIRSQCCRAVFAEMASLKLHNLTNSIGDIFPHLVNYI